MFGFFGGDKNKKKGKGGGGKPGQNLSKEELIKQAMANARKAKDEIGEENIQRMAQMLKEQQSGGARQNSPAHSSHGSGPVSFEDNPQSDGYKAREEIRKMDGKDIANHLRNVIDEDR